MLLVFYVLLMFRSVLKIPDLAPLPDSSLFFSQTEFGACLIPLKVVLNPGSHYWMVRASQNETNTEKSPGGLTVYTNQLGLLHPCPCQHATLTSCPAWPLRKDLHPFGDLLLWFWCPKLFMATMNVIVNINIRWDIFLFSSIFYEIKYHHNVSWRQRYLLRVNIRAGSHLQS